jgi:hypothetical protein
MTSSFFQWPHPSRTEADGVYGMIHRASLVLAVALSCLLGVAAAARGIKESAFVGGNKLDEACGDGTAFDAGFCYGYVFGIVDSAESSQFAKGPRVWCWPDDLSLDQAMDQSVEVVKLYLQHHPENRQFTGDSLVAAALKEKFPCN